MKLWHRDNTRRHNVKLSSFLFSHSSNQTKIHLPKQSKPRLVSASRAPTRCFVVNANIQPPQLCIIGIGIVAPAPAPHEFPAIIDDDTDVNGVVLSIAVLLLLPAPMPPIVAGAEVVAVVACVALCCVCPAVRADGPIPFASSSNLEAFPFEAAALEAAPAAAAVPGARMLCGDVLLMIVDTLSGCSCSAALVGDVAGVACCARAADDGNGGGICCGCACCCCVGPLLLMMMLPLDTVDVDEL